MLLGWIIATAGAADLRVGPGRAFSELQDAVDAASRGDRILLDAGTYGPVDVDVDVEIIGLGPAVITAAAGVAVDVTANVTLRGLVLDGSGSARVLRIGHDAEVVVEDSVLRNGWSDDQGGCVRIDGAVATFRRSTVSGCVAPSGGGIYAGWSRLVLDAVTVTDAIATSGIGGGLAIEDGTLTAHGSRFDGNLADDRVGEPHLHGLGGGIFSGSSTLDLHGCTFVGNEARSFGPDSGRGGALRLWLTDARVDRCVFESDTASAYGSAIAAASSTLALSASELRSNLVTRREPESAWGGAVFCDEFSDCAVTRSWFEANTAGDGGAICTLGALGVTTSMFCANTATSDGGAIDFGNVVSGASVTVSGNVLARNTATLGGGAIVVTAGPHDVTNNHLVGNGAGIGGAVAWATPHATDALVLMGNLVAGNTSADGPVLDLGGIPFVEDFDWFWQNAPTSLALPPGGSGGEGNPGLAGPVDSCDPQDLLLGATSPLRDAGPQGGGWTDTDGSRNDIGGFGGPNGDASAFLDADGDGAVGMVDCADDDPTVHPGAPERCNGIDDDCDELRDADDLASDAGWLFRDADADGSGGDADAAWRCPGPGWASVAGDCDDTDPERAESCTSAPGGDEGKGGGVAQPPEPEFGFGCATGPGPGPLGLLAVAGMVSRRRRVRRWT